MDESLPVLVSYPACRVGILTFLRVDLAGFLEENHTCPALGHILLDTLYYDVHDQKILAVDSSSFPAPTRRDRPTFQSTDPSPADQHWLVADLSGSSRHQLGHSSRRLLRDQQCHTQA